MNETQINYLLSVAETGSFTVAAELNHVQQPAISSYIRRLEDNLGFQLFNRNKHGVQLTSAGHVFVSWLKETYQGFHAIREQALSMDRHHKSSVHLGMLAYYRYEPLYEAISLTKQQYPNASFYLEVQGPNELMANAVDGKYDILFCEEEIVRNFSSLSYQEIDRIEWVIIYSRFSKYAQKEHLTLSDFSDESFIGPGNLKDNQTNLLPFHNALFKNAGLLYPKVTPAPNVESTIFQIQADLGVGFCTKSYAQSLSDTLMYLDADFTSSVGIATPIGSSFPLLDALIKNLKYCITKRSISSRLN